MPICKLCGDEKKLCKAHVIPKSFFKAMIGIDGDLDQYSVEHPKYSKKRPMGHYDKNILCADCDRRFSVVDEYGAKTLIQRESEILQITKQGHTHYTLPNVNGMMFRRFLATVLWRASICESSMFSQVSLGGTEEFAKCIALAEKDPEPKDYAYVVAKYDPGKLNMVIANPTTSRVDNMRFIRIFLPGYIVHVKTCGRKLPPDFQRAQSLGDHDMHMMGKDFRDLDTFGDFVKLARGE